MRLSHAMALAHDAIVSFAVMLDAIPQLSEELAIQGVPVIFVGNQRVQGATTEWVLVQRLLQIRNDSVQF